MWTDVIDLRDFYASGLGRVARRMIGRRVRDLWPDTAGLNILGIGYPTPYLGQFRTDAQRTLALMPAAQGVIHWPANEAGLTLLADEAELPLPDMSMDRILVVHALEHTQDPNHFLREIWRLLTGSGRVLIVVPNRSGVWARIERTPFGNGLPYTAHQLNRLLRDSMFTPLGTQRALFVPPTQWRAVLASAGAFENVGLRWFSTFAGAVMVEATKQVYAATPLPAARERAYVPVAQRHPCVAGFNRVAGSDRAVRR